MIFRAITIRAVGVAALLLGFVSIAEAESLYRYRNAEGVVVVGYQVPVESVAGGYEILNEKGMVIKVMPRALTPEERKQKDALEKQQQEARAEQERLRQWDESLMLRYSTEADIEDARRRALGELKIRLSILRGNKRSIKQKVENYQAQAADTERAGQKVDVERLRAIESLQEEIATTDHDIKEREGEIAALSASFDADVERFRMLQDVIQLRQELSAAKSKSTGAAR